MKATTLQSRTIRPGNLNGYSFYYSGKKANRVVIKKKRTHKLKTLFALILILAITVPIAAYARSGTKKPLISSNTAATTSTTTSTTQKEPAAQPQSAAAATPAPVTQCSSNTLPQLVKVSIGQRHMWACNHTSVAYDAPVVTGISYLAADVTPTGTYHIYEMRTDQTLTGHDSTGSWDDFVYYWMPFLSNQYGVYGFHDATWRSPSDFGNISPDSSNASHGCVELPLATAKWLYNWVDIGTTVSIVD